MDAAFRGGDAEFRGGAGGELRFAAKKVWIVFESLVTFVNPESTDGVDQFRGQFVHQTSDQFRGLEGILRH